MKQLATVALMLSFGVALVHAQQRPVDLTFSGTSVASTLNLQPNTSTGEENFAGNGTLGPFTYTEIQAGSASPQPPPSTCSSPTQLYFPIVTGAGVFRFLDGSLLMVKIVDGATCADLAAGVGHVTVTYQITGGTGLLKGASGTLSFTALTVPLLFTATNDPVFLAVTGNFTGTVTF